MQTEKEKAAAGLIYDADNDPELQQEMLQTRQKLHTYNQLEAYSYNSPLRMASMTLAGGRCASSSFFMKSM